ncbi:cAMP-binding protein [Leptolyngbya sp. PCC 7375]|nr:cAMP-binding protein [Leptolyngbya sp. PCC 7375]
MESLDRYLEALKRLFEKGLIEVPPSLSPVKTGEIIFHGEEPAEKIFGVKTGKVQLVRYLENGQMSHQYAVDNGSWFGESALFNDVYSNSAIATEPSLIVAIPKQAFLTLLHQDPEISLIFISELTEQLHIAKNIMTLRCIRSASDRVLAYLYNLKTPGQNICVLNCPIKAIAEQICLTPEVVSRSLRKLQDDGIIQRNQRKIIFLEG